MIKFDLNNRVAVVTGGAQGFGLAITQRFIEAGAKVVIWDIDESATKEAINKLKSENLSHQVVDVTNFEIVNKNLEELEKKHGKIDIIKVDNEGEEVKTVKSIDKRFWNSIDCLNIDGKSVREFVPIDFNYSKVGSAQRFCKYE